MEGLLLVAVGAAGVGFLAVLKKLNELTDIHIEWTLIELKFAEPGKVRKKPIRAKAPRAAGVASVPRQLKSVKKLSR